MKRLNIKLAVALAIAFLVVGAGVHFLHAYQVDRNAEGVLEQANLLYGEKELEDAYQFAGRYLNLRNEDLRGSKLLADIAYDIAELPGSSLKHKRRAFAEMERAVRLDPTDKERRRKLLDYHIKFYSFSAALDHAKLLRDGSELDPELELITAKCFAYTGEFDEAAKICRELIGFDALRNTFTEKAPGRNNIEAYALLAQLSHERKSGTEAQADAVIERMVAVNPDSTKAYVFAHSYWKETRRPDRAKEALAKAFELEPDSPDVVLPMAEQARDDNKLDEAEALLGSALKAHPQEPLLYRAMAQIKMRRQDLQAVVDILQEGLKQLPDNELLLHSVVGAQIEKGETEQARSALKKLRELGLDDSSFEIFNAQFLMRDRKWADAHAKLEQVRNKVIHNPHLLAYTDTLLAKCEQAQGDLKAAGKRFATLARQSDDATEADLGVAQVELMSGRYAEALKLYETLAEKLGNRSLEIEQVWQPLLRLRAWDQMRLSKDQQNWSKFEALVNDLNQAGQLDPISYLSLQGDLLVNKQDFAAARRLYAEGLEQHPQSAELWAARLDLELQDGGPEQAMKLADAAPVAIQNGIVLGLAKAAIFAKMEGDAGKAGLIALEKSAARLKPEDQLRLLHGLVLNIRERKDRESTKRVLGVIRAQWKDDLLSRHLTFDTAREDGDISTMHAMAAEIGGIAPPDSAYPPLFEAVARITSVTVSQRPKVEADPKQVKFVLSAEEKAELREARKLLEAVAEKHAASNEAHKWLADICAFENDADGMLTQLQTAASKGPLDNRRQRQLYDLLVAKGRTAEAQQVYAQLQGASAEGTEWSQIVIMIQGKQFEEARKLLDSIEPKSDATIEELLRHADARRRINDLPKAEALLRQAVQVDSGSTQAWVALVSILAAQKKSGDAQAAITAAQARVPADQREMVLAQCYEALQDEKRAEETYLKLVAAKPGDLAVNQAVAGFYLRNSRFKDAGKYLDAIDRDSAAAKTAADKEIVAWSRRGRAVVLANEGSWQRFKEAEALLRAADAELRKQGGEPSAADLLLRISLWSNRSEPSSVRTAVALFEELQKRQPLQTHELVNLARLYERVGDWHKTKEIMLGVLGARDPEPLHYLAYAEMLLRNGEYGDVELWLDRYDAIGRPGISIPIRVRLRVRQNRPQEAVALVQRSLGQLGPKPWPKQKLDSIQAAAVLLQDVKLYEHAEKYWRAYADVDKTRLIFLAKCVGLYRDLDEAFALLDASLKHTAPHNALVFGMQILRARKAEAAEQHFAALGRYYQAAMQADPGNLSLEMMLGDIWELRGKLDQAEQVYRKLLGNSDLNPVLRAGLANNLAFILSAQQKNTAEALKLIEGAMEVYGPSSDLLDTRGMVHLAAGKPGSAIVDFKEAVLDPSAMKWVHLALAQNATGDRQGARASLKKAQDLDLKREDLYEVEWNRYEALAKELGTL